MVVKASGGTSIKLPIMVGLGVFIETPDGQVRAEVWKGLHELKKEQKTTNKNTE